ncbi:PQQ-binding-like beta-propeller repeat protein [Nocardiopsis ganjiahuensis]|uniref:PQQ-binding-like beta-propeller repeat protein n=1 Tax=Nocardiopsis ganjiahuensis TaxID=239984 RepID=UPI000348AECB|nr:PQQ-binding-like beta-propeller repeat protein [Nocardiopsis ganjiahuensis]
MGGRLGGVFGWAGLAVLVGGGVLALEPLAGLSSHSPRSTELTWPLGAAVLIALLTVFALLLSAANPEARPEERPQRGQFLFRVCVAAVGLFLAWIVLPTRHLDSEARHAAGGAPPAAAVELSVAVCLVALGLVLLLGASSALQIRRWPGALLGVGAGALVVVLVMALTPALSRLLLVEHTVTNAGREPAPVPADVTRVGWIWQPEHPVVDMGRGPQGPIVRYEDGFVGLDGETGEELWSYRLPYARNGETGFFAGDEGYVHLFHQARPDEDQTLVVLDAATGEVVRDAVMPGLGEDGPEHGSHLTPEGRFFLEHGTGGAVVTAYATDSTERLWEFPLEDSPEGRVCLTAGGDGIRGHGDRLLVARICLDEGHISDGEPAFGAGDSDVPDDALETLIVLDTATGEELWRQEWAPRQPMTVNAPGVRQGREWLGCEAVVVTGHGLHGLETGEPVEARGEGAEDAASRSGEVLAADTGGTVVLRDADEEERTALVLETDAGGEVTRETGVAAPGSYFQLSGALPLAEALVSTRAVRHLTAEARSERALLVVPLGGEAEEEDLRWIRFDGEEVPEADGVEHRVLAVPGAVVSYVHAPDNTADRPHAVHGLVP